ncbi:MAG: nucleoside-diphosphate kinase [Candidatus Babeliales bacterium]
MEEITFAMIKPDAIQAKDSGKIIDLTEQHGFDIIRMHKVWLTEQGAQTFYAVHKDKPFFQELVKFVTSGPVIIMALLKENAIQDWRKLMGETDPVQAEEETIRKKFGKSISENAVHGSDSIQTAVQELSLFFPELIDTAKEEVKK